jgi:uncharacterized protein
VIWFGILALGLVAGTVGGIVGFGSSIMLMPALVLAFGPKEAVPIMAIAGLMANFSRVAVWWREVDWRAAAAFSATAVPAAALGALTLVSIDARLVELALGVFFIAMIPVRRWLLAQGWTVSLGQLVLAGAGIGYLSGIVASVGPINTPFFVAHGLLKGAFLSTEALSSAAMGLAKSAVFRRFDVMPLDTVVRGLIVGGSVMVGSWVAKSFVLKLDPDRFRLLMDALLLLAGLIMLFSAWQATS